MTVHASAALRELEELYAAPHGEVDFRSMADSIEAGDDAALAELIEADGRLRLTQGRPIELERYLRAVPDLHRRPVPLDAALDVALRALAGKGAVTPEGVARLVQQHPELERPIREAAALNAAIWSTTGLRASIAPPPAKSLPCGFGPTLPTGEHRYELQKLLGQGAFGQVYLALDRQLSEEGHTAMVAIKVLVAGGRSPWARQRMIEEATKVRRISHANVVSVIDRGVTEHDEDFIVYEFVDGGDLSDLLTAGRRLGVRDAAAMVMQIARGVHAAHSAGVIHCDLKPGNIMLTAAGVPKVTDFGIAVRLTDSVRAGAATEGDAGSASHRAPIGNLAFVSPEQYRGEEGALSVLSDIYALGGILYVLLTGQLPNGSTLEEIAATHAADGGRQSPPLVRPWQGDADADLEAICRRALEALPQRRYNSAAAFAEDLERWLNLEPISWTRPSFGRVVRLWGRRKPALALSIATIALLVIVGSIVALYLDSVARQRAFEAAVNKANFEKEEEFRKRGIAASQSLRDAIKVLKSEYRFAAEALTYVWVFEYLYGPAVFGMPDVETELWKTRIAQTRNLISITRQSGREDDLEPMLWESALAFWLVCDKDYAEAEPLLERNLAKWRSKLAPGDGWLADLEAIQLCAAVNRHLASTQAPPRDPAQLRQLESALSAAAAGVAQRHRGTPIHFLVLGAIRDLHAPNLLNDAQHHQRLSDELTAIRNDTAVKVAKKPATPAAEAPAATAK